MLYWHHDQVHSTLYESTKSMPIGNDNDLTVGIDKQQPRCRGKGAMRGFSIVLVTMTYDALRQIPCHLKLYTPLLSPRLSSARDHFIRHGSYESHRRQEAPA